MESKRIPTMNDDYVVRVLYSVTDEVTERQYNDYNKACAYLEGCIDTLVNGTRVAMVSLRNESTNELILRTGVNDEDGHWRTEGYATYTDGDGFKDYDLDIYKARFI